MLARVPSLQRSCVIFKLHTPTEWGASKYSASVCGHLSDQKTQFELAVTSHVTQKLLWHHRKLSTRPIDSTCLVTSLKASMASTQNYRREIWKLYLILINSPASTIKTIDHDLHCYHLYGNIYSEKENVWSFCFVRSHD